MILRFLVWSIAVFFFGKWNYKMRPTEGNIMVDVSKCVTVIISSMNFTLIKCFG